MSQKIINILNIILSGGGRVALQPLSLASPNDLAFPDDGIGTSDDDSETLSCNSGGGGGNKNIPDEPPAAVAAAAAASAAKAAKKVITLDMGQLLAFDEVRKNIDLALLCFT